MKSKKINKKTIVGICLACCLCGGIFPQQIDPLNNTITVSAAGGYSVTTNYSNKVKLCTNPGYKNGGRYIRIQTTAKTNVYMYDGSGKLIWSESGAIGAFKERKFWVGSNIKTVKVSTPGTLACVTARW